MPTTSPARPTAHPPWPTVATTRGDEPVLGRSRELAELRQALGRSRLVTLTGQVGIGKTVLARAAATDHARTRREDTWTVDLADLVDPGLLGPALADVLGVRHPGGSGALDLAPALADHAGLLVLDSCETAYDAVVPLVPELLRAAPRLRVLATSRRQLGVTGEVVVPVGPLAAEDAQALFHARASAALPSFRLTEDNSAAVAELCSALEGVPLAVELAAARVNVLPVQGILDRLGGRLDDRQRLLGKGARTAPDRQRSLRASLEASSELCTPDELRLWARLSVFTAGFELEAAEAVCAGDGIHEADVLDLVDALLEKSVLVREDDGASYVRFRMPEPLREYGAELLTPEEQKTWLDAHLTWVAGLVRASAEDFFGPRQAERYRTLRREHGNLREALRHAVGDPRHRATALDMVTALEPYWVATGRLDEARHWLAHALPADPVDPGTRVRALAMAAWTGVVRGEPAPVGTMLGEAEALLADDTPGPALARVLHARAVATLRSHGPEKALSPLRRAVTAGRAAGDRFAEASALLLLGLGQGLAADLDAAAEDLRTCVDLTESAGELHLRSYALAGLAAVVLLREDPHTAGELATQSLTAGTEVADHLATAFALEVLARAAALEGRPDRAATLLGAADRRWRRRGLDPAAVPMLADHLRRLDEVVRVEHDSAALRAAFDRGRDLTDEQVLADALEQPTTQDEPDELAVLTRRELEVARLLGAGLSNREIAEQLGRSQRTVESHVEHVLRKLGFGSRTQVAAWMADHQARRR